MEEKHKEWIDSASYEDLLLKWRFSPTGDPLFKGDTGDYYFAKMKEKRAEIGEAGHVAASKKVGWA